jgi:hypothetical protein
VDLLVIEEMFKGREVHRGERMVRHPMNLRPISIG